MNNNQPTIPERIFVGYLGGRPFWGPETPDTHPENARYIRADLSRPRLTDEEVEKLRQCADPVGDKFYDGRIQGWNDCIDHLRQRGII